MATQSLWRGMQGKELWHRGECKQFPIFRWRTTRTNNHFLVIEFDQGRFSLKAHITGKKGSPNVEGGEHSVGRNQTSWFKNIIFQGRQGEKIWIANLMRQEEEIHLSQCGFEVIEGCNKMKRETTWGIEGGQKDEENNYLALPKCCKGEGDEFMLSEQIWGMDLVVMCRGRIPRFLLRRNKGRNAFLGELVN